MEALGLKMSLARDAHFLVGLDKTPVVGVDFEVLVSVILGRFLDFIRSRPDVEADGSRFVLGVRRFFQVQELGVVDQGGNRQAQVSLQ